MNCFFNSKEREKILFDELEKWKNTTFRYNCCGRGTPSGSADCVSFPLNVFKNIGLIQRDYTTPKYISVRSRENELGKIYSGIGKIKGLELVWTKEDSLLKEAQIKFGDLLICSSGRAIHHLLIYTGDGILWHCWPKSGVVKIPFATEQIHRTAQRIYRFFEE